MISGCLVPTLLMGHIGNSIVASNRRSKIIGVIRSILMVLVVMHLVHVLLLLLLLVLGRGLLDYTAANIAATSWS